MWLWKIVVVHWQIYPWVRRQVLWSLSWLDYMNKTPECVQWRNMDDLTWQFMLKRDWVSKYRALFSLESNIFSFFGKLQRDLKSQKGGTKSKGKRGHRFRQLLEALTQLHVPVYQISRHVWRTGFQNAERPLQSSAQRLDAMLSGEIFGMTKTQTPCMTDKLNSTFMKSRTEMLDSKDLNT